MGRPGGYNTLIHRLRKQVEQRGNGMVARNPRDGYCCATVDLGVGWVANNFPPVHCSRRAKDTVFCGQHDHIWAAIGCESLDDFVARHGARVEYNDRGEVIAYYAPIHFRKKPKVVPFEEGPAPPMPCRS